LGRSGYAVKLIFFPANQLTARRARGQPACVRRILLLTLLTLLPVALGIAPGGARGDLPKLVGTVGPGFTIDLADASGKHVDVLPAGQYELLVHDLSSEHNFVLGSKTTGARIASTEVPSVGDETFTISLSPGPYAYACSPHFEVMNGRLQVVAAAPVETPLSGKVTSRTVTLSAKSVAAGPVKLTVSDASRKRNFHLVGAGVNRKTGKAFAGKVTWHLDLAAGTYKFGSDPRLTGRLVVRAG
jgi:plastocyanin